MTLAERYIQKARDLMPHQDALYEIDPGIDCPQAIDEIIFSRSEYLGGMAAVILEIVKRESNPEMSDAERA
ncbi:hypothetical protein VRRI112168_02495 [Vreelandella rituensis]|uniref:Uncharacterized protein n=1 Tax=Vreelandella rituensis TaxID=2282306 RepID=A0A368UD44_9GAMM|nr:hypothetical protein [Halomonas rituensis]RCV93613.1 hypothetical protein DU506_00215 [Halomonas rituensis]